MTETLADIARMTQRLEEIARQNGTKLFLVGGVVRDILRGAPCNDRDLDVVVEGNSLDFAGKAEVALGGTLKRFPDFFTAKLLGPANGGAIDEIDFASTRTERYPAPGALPVVEIATIADDLRRRDFSINAMAVELARYSEYVSGRLTRADFEAAVIDEHSGREDLAKKAIRVLHARSFIDDPTRLFRACRYAARINGDLEPRTAELFAEALSSGALTSISRYRVATEIRKMVFENPGSPVFEVAEKLGLLRESGIVAAERHSEFAEFAASQQRGAGGISEDARLREFMKGIVVFSGRETAEQRLSAFGISKRKIREIIEEAIP